MKNHGFRNILRYSLGLGACSVGRWRPMTWYSVRRPVEFISHHFRSDRYISSACALDGDERVCNSVGTRFSVGEGGRVGVFCVVDGWSRKKKKFDMAIRHYHG